jgi:hypothetical protein
MQGGLSQPMTRDEIRAAHAPTDPREAVGAGFGNALGLVGSDNPRYQSLDNIHPNYVAGGQGMGYGVEAGLALAGGPAAVRGAAGLVRGAANMAPWAGEMAVRGAAPIVKYGVAPLHAVHGDLGGAYAVYRGGKALSTLGQAMKAARTGGDVGKIAEGLNPEEISKLFEVLKHSHH